jgi:uncharacterized protein (UPF0261 family)
MARAFVIGTCDTKGPELAYIKALLEAAGVPGVLVDVGIRSDGAAADVSPREVAACHPEGADRVFVDDRGAAIAAMAEALCAFLASRDDVGGAIGAGGSGGTALISPALRALPVGVPKVLVSTVASGNVGAYVGPADICMMYSVTDVQGLNSISRRVLGNAAHALAGMMRHQIPAAPARARPALGLTMFGVTTPCVQQVAGALEADYDCLVFHATGTGGQSMEKLVESGLIAGVIDVTTTEVCDLLLGGVFSAGEDRLGAIVRTGVPYVGSCGALDMVNFGAMETVPERYRGRNLYVHNPQVTLMRTTPEENVRMGEWLAERLNRMQGPVADAALFDTLEAKVAPGPNRKLIRLPGNVNDPAFAAALVAAFREIAA